MVQVNAAATAAVAVILAASAFAAPVTNIEAANLDISSHAQVHNSHHHATRELGAVEELDTRFFRKIARKIFGRDLGSSTIDGELEARDPSWQNKVGNRNFRRERESTEELEARFIKRIARTIFGREFDLDEVEARHEHTSEHHHKRDHHHLQKHVERALEGMSDQELQARAPIFRRIARKIFGRDLAEEELETRSPIFRRIARKIFGRNVEEEELEAREPLFFLGKIAKKVLGPYIRDVAGESLSSVAARSFEELD
ncbi:hypothetical protein MD484_g6425, partial [Candolleomyces efflorescens]